MKNMNRRGFLSQSLFGAAAIPLVAKTIAAVLPADADKAGKPSGPNEPKPQFSAQKQVDYDEAVKTKYPEQCIIVIAKDKNGKPNPMTMGWTMITSGSPPMMAISMGTTRYTTEAIRHSKCFTIAFPSAEQAKAVLFFGTTSGRDIDKFKEFPTRTEPAKQIDSVLLTDAVANFECRLESEFVTGDHLIFVGRIVASHVNTTPKKRLYITGPGKKLGPVEAKT
jgi:flavin reductase (DIM6/NTAB) family NADH-FMN oxidoreductase RutF